MSIRIMVDSAADLDPQDYSEYNIELMPLSVIVDGRIYAADMQFNKRDFFRLLETSPIFPTTSQPAPADMEAVFEATKQQGDELIFITVSSALSGTYQSAFVLKEMGEYDNVYLVDSKTASVAIRLLALHGAQLRERGFSASEIAARLTALRDRVRIYAGLDTLEYLYKGGRLSRAAAGLGTLARVKPIVTTNLQGTVAMAGKGLGKGKAMSLIASLLEATPPDPHFPICGLFSSREEPLRELAEKLEKKGYSLPEDHWRGIGPVIGAHVGTDAYGVTYIAK